MGKDRKLAAVSLSELRRSMGRVLARVKAGDEIVATERGKPVARIVPYAREDDAEMERLRKMERAGLLRIGKGELPKDFWKRPLPKDPKGLVLKAILEERRKGR